MSSTGYSEGASENFLSEPCSYPDLESSQTSIELTFHSISQVKEKERERGREGEMYSVECSDIQYVQRE